jgi:integrase
VGQQNATELQVFIWVLRYTGLRISDAVLLERNQLVLFEHRCYTHALYCHPRKTRKKRRANFVHIPIPNGKLPGHPNLVEALQNLPVKNGRYFFYGGKGTLRTNVNSWRNRIGRLFQIAARVMAEHGKKFAYKPHPHRFRHTFAAALLQNGVSLRIVAQHLGDTEDIVRRHYAKFCLAEQREAADTLAEAMLRMVAKETEQRKAGFKVVSGG